MALDVGRGEIVVILGANGAGKTTLLKAIAGLVPAAAGARITLDGRELPALPSHHIVEAGIALVPEGRGIFGELDGARKSAARRLSAARARARARTRRSTWCWHCSRGLRERLRQPCAP